MILIMLTKLAKPSAVVVSAYLFQSASQGGSFLQKAFDYGLSTGLMALVVIMLYKEWKASQNYNKARDEKLESLIEQNTKAFNGMQVSIDNLADEQSQFRQELKYIHKRVDTNRELIEKRA